jgi:copper chaperone CopZ
VSRQIGKATVTFDSRKTDAPAICKAILKSGYKPALT